MDPRIHATAIIEEGARIGSQTIIWDNVHIRAPCEIGKQCIIGGKSYIAYGVTIADRVKINANVYVCTGVTIEQGVMVSAGTIFTNDRFPRATIPDLSELQDSAPNEHTLTTKVREGATIGAGAIVGCDLEIGRFAMVGMGSVVTRSISDFALTVGNPARVVGFVTRRGEPWLKFSPWKVPDSAEYTCSDGYSYHLSMGQVIETPPE